MQQSPHAFVSAQRKLIGYGILRDLRDEPCEDTRKLRSSLNLIRPFDCSKRSDAVILSMCCLNRGQADLTSGQTVELHHQEESEKHLFLLFFTVNLHQDTSCCQTAGKFRKALQPLVCEFVVSDERTDSTFSFKFPLYVQRKTFFFFLRNLCPVQQMLLPRRRFFPQQRNKQLPGHQLRHTAHSDCCDFAQ